MYVRFLGLSFIITRRELGIKRPLQIRRALVAVKIVALAPADDDWQFTTLEREDTQTRFQVDGTLGQLGDEFMYKLEVE